MVSRFSCTGSNYERHCNAQACVMPLLLLVLKEKPHYCDVHGNHRKCSSILFEEFKRKIADTLDQRCSYISTVSGGAAD